MNLNTNSRWYDTKEGIEKNVGSLKSLNLLLDMRRKAYYTHREKLKDFFVFGFLSLDSCGNCGVLSENDRQFNPRTLPKVLTNDEYWSAVRKLIGEDEVYGLMFGMGNKTVPKEDVFCTHCGDYWTVDNCEDLVVSQKQETYDGAEFAGKTLGELEDILSRKCDGTYLLCEHPIRNDCFIDLSEKYPGATEDWKKDHPVNQHGWMSLAELGGLSYKIQPSDTIAVNSWHQYHKKCYEEYLTDLEHKKFSEFFEKAGYGDITLVAVPNEYCRNPHCCPPWFVADIPAMGKIKIGRRKRVYNIDFSSIRQNQGWFDELNIAKLFSEENVTKDADLIHAWGDEKAVEYLGRVREAVL
jgi:hypothetical protein